MEVVDFATPVFVGILTEVGAECAPTVESDLAIGRDAADGELGRVAVTSARTDVPILSVGGAGQQPAC